MELVVGFSIIALLVFSILFLVRKYKKRNKIKFYKKEPVLNRMYMQEYPDDKAEKQYESLVEQGQFEVSIISEDTILADESTEESSQPSHAIESPEGIEGQLIYITLLSKPDKPYAGYELLQSLLAVGLRFGQMNIFHRYEQTSGRGRILFSLASATEPGTFELNKMGAFSTRGLSLFMRLTSSSKDLMSAFDLMQDTASQLIEDLGGDIMDDERKPLTSEKIEMWRKKVVAFEQKQKIYDLFESDSVLM